MRDDTASSSSSARWCRADSAASRAASTASAAWSTSETSTSSSSSVGRRPAHGLVDGDDPEQEASLVAHRNEERVLGIPGVGVARPPPLRHVARPERVPVDGAARHDVGATPLEALGEEHRPVFAGPRVPEQHRLRLLVPVHRRHLEVVPLGPVEVDRDGQVAERLADGSGDSVEQRRKILTRPQKAGHLDEAPQR